MNTIEAISNALYDYLNTTFAIPAEILPQVLVTLNTDEDKQQFGDLSTNAALVLAKTLGKSPRAIAEQIKKEFSHPDIDSLEIAGPGFINLFITQAALQTLVAELMENGEQFFKPTDIKPVHYSVEFVSANPTGPLHLGHGRGGIIGDVLGNVLRFCRNTVTKEFYINDAGSQIKKLGNSFKLRCRQALGQDVTLPEDAYHGTYLTDLAQQLVDREGEDILKKPDSFFSDYAKNALLQNIRDTLLAYGIEYNVWFSEKSLYEQNLVAPAIETLTKRGYTFAADGALWFKSTAFGDDKDRVLIRSNGEYTYIASDVAYLLDKIGRGAEHLIFVLGQDHHSYVIRLKAIMQALGYDPTMLDVILYQLVTIKESGELVRMSKRAGHIVSLDDIIKTVGKDVARFFYLHRKADAHLDFDLDLALKHTEENPVYYIQYAYVRTGSMLAKAQKFPELENLTNADIKGIGPEEKLIVKKIVSLKELIANISSNYQIHLLTYYAIELAHTFHRYYAENRVIDVADVTKSRARLIVIKQLRMTFETLFTLLELSMPEQM